MLKKIIINLDLLFGTEDCGKGELTLFKAANQKKWSGYYKALFGC